jgi:hypothetical protein
VAWPFPKSRWCWKIRHWRKGSSDREKPERPRIFTLPSFRDARNGAAVTDNLGGNITAMSGGCPTCYGTFSYDPRGNLYQSYTLVAGQWVTQNDSYDAFGRRYGITVTTGSGTTPLSYMYDGLNVVIAATAIESGWSPPLAAWHAIKVSIGLGIASAIIWAAVARASSHNER